ncbi:MAG: hypothetical protein ACOYL6_12335 [Bacteriovoracaceae bacterium]
MTSISDKVKFKLMKVKNPFSKVFSTEDSRFMLMVGLKVVALPILASSFLLYMFWLTVHMNLIYFEANGFRGLEELREAYYGFIFNQVSNIIPWAGLFLICLFLSGLYMGSLLLRPFKIIGDYCDQAVNDPNSSYEPDMFSDFKLLTRFSEFFFAYVLQCRKEGKLNMNIIPPSFTKIHKPVFDRVFFFHYFLYLSIISITSSVFMITIADDIQESIIELAIKSLKLSGKNSTYFLQEQSFMFNTMIWVAVAIVAIGYLFLAFHLYNRVAGAAFGFFTTMRSFMKGSYHNRVHLLDFNHVRPFSRSFNKFLDYLQKNLEHKK